jgi:hypothetical protein
MRYDDFIVAAVTALYVVCYALHPCGQLPAWLVRHVFSIRITTLLTLALVPVSCALGDRVLAMGVATVATLAYGDFLAFS